jgi:eukaryotic-like serine/threonine-protein kinase
MLSSGQIVRGRYQVVEVVGGGSQAKVYKALDLHGGHIVAVKETTCEDDKLRAAYEREASILANLPRHNALPIVYGAFAERNTLYLILEFIPGEDFAGRLKKVERFTPVDVLAWADQLLDALELLHSQSVPLIHRDINPRNLKLGGQNEIMLLDFGISKYLSERTLVSSYSNNYSPLEQIRDQGTDERSDIYSLAATLYHLLTGLKPPDSMFERFAAISKGGSDPLQPANVVRGDVPPHVAEALSRAMGLFPEHRFSHAFQMRAALRDDDLTRVSHKGVLTEKAVNPRLEITTDSRGVSQPRVPPSVTTPVQQPTPPTQKYGILGWCDDEVMSVAFSPDGKTIVSGSIDKSVRLWDTRTGLQLDSRNCGEAIFKASFSPDGRSVAIATFGKKILLWDLNKNLLKSIGALYGHGNEYDFVFSPDSKIRSGV